MSLPSTSGRELAKSGAVAALVRESSGEVELAVRGDCMRPWLEPGDRVGVVASRLLLPGDIVVLAAEDGRYLVHRFLGWRRHRGRAAIVSRADDADKSDLPVPVHRVLGRVAWVAGATGTERMRVPWLLRGESFVQWLRLGLGGLWRWWRSGGGRS